MGCVKSRQLERQVLLTRTERTESLNTQTKTTVIGERAFEKALHERAAANSNPRSVALARALVQNDMLQLSFTPHELGQLIKLFRDEMDDKKRETMSFDTFGRIVNIRAGTHSNAMIMQLFRNFDDDGDGVLTLREFLQGFSYWKEHLWTNTDRLFFFFTLFDTDRNGTLDRNEFTAMIRHIMAAQIFEDVECDNIASDTRVQNFIRLLFRGTKRERVERSRNASDVGKPAQAQRQKQEQTKTETRGEEEYKEQFSLTFEEYAAWVRANPVAVRQLGRSEEELLDSFSKYDIDANGALEFNEIVSMLRAHGTGTSTSLLLEGALPADVEAQVKAYVEEAFSMQFSCDDGSGAGSSAAAASGTGGNLTYAQYQLWASQRAELGARVLRSKSQAGAGAGAGVGGVGDGDGGAAGARAHAGTELSASESFARLIIEDDSRGDEHAAATAQPGCGTTAGQESAELEDEHFAAANPAYAMDSGTHPAEEAAEDAQEKTQRRRSSLSAMQHSSWVTHAMQAELGSQHGQKTKMSIELHGTHCTAGTQDPGLSFAQRRATDFVSPSRGSEDGESIDTTTQGRQSQQRRSLSTVIYDLRRKSVQVLSALRSGQRSGRDDANGAEGGDEVQQKPLGGGVRGASDAGAALGVGMGTSLDAPVRMPSSLPDDPEAEQSSVSPGAGGAAVE